MTTIDAKALSRRAGHILFTDGPEQPAATARETVLLLDALAEAEARLQAVREVLDNGTAAGSDHVRLPIPQYAIRAIRRALDGDRWGKIRHGNQTETTKDPQP